MIALLLAAFVGMALIDLPGLIKMKYKRETAVYCVFFAASFILAFLYFKGANIPSPIKGVQYIIIDVLHLGY
jgi:hypothetical protein